MWPKGLTTPGAPTSVSASAGNAQATVTFTAPVDTGGTSITSYTVTSSPGSITATGSSSPITVTGLTNGTAYTFTVTATNAQGTGPASSASGSVTPSATVTFVWTKPPSNTSMTFSNDDRTATNGGSSYQTAFAALPTVSGGKYYWEVTETISNAYGNTGLGTSTSNNQFYQDTAGNYYIQRSSDTSFTNQGSWSNNGLTSTSYSGASVRFGYAYDVDTGKVWVRINGGSWIGGGNPASGTTPTVTISGTVYLVGSTYDSNTESFTITSKTAQTDTPPSGFTAIGG